MKNKNKWGKRLENISENLLENPSESLPLTHGSGYLLARDAQAEDGQKDLLYELLGPIFFGKKEAETEEELVAFFETQYGIDVRGDFCEGDEHYEEYQEAQQAIAEGLAVYGGSIEFEETALAELAQQLWDRLESQEKRSFRRINTLLEE